MNLGETIYRLRTKQAMSQDTLAEALGVSRQSVSKWENNAAVPELEKLIKMSELFGVTLDELVGREAPAPTPPPPAAAPTQSHSTRKTVGIILLCFGLLTTLLLSILGGFITGVFLGLPFTITGSLLLSNSKEPLFHAAWGFFAVYAPLLNFFMLNFMGFGLYVKALVIGIWFAALILWVIVRHKNGKLSEESRKFIKRSLIIALALTIILTIATSIMYRRSGLQSANEALDASIIEVDEWLPFEGSCQRS